MVAMLNSISMKAKLVVEGYIIGHTVALIMDLVLNFQNTGVMNLEMK